MVQNKIFNDLTIDQVKDSQMNDQSVHSLSILLSSSRLQAEVLSTGDLKKPECKAPAPGRDKKESIYFFVCPLCSCSRAGSVPGKITQSKKSKHLQTDK